MVSPLARRVQLDFVRARGLSLRRACGLIGMSRATPSYQLRLPTKDAPVLTAMRELSAQYPRYGYRRIRIFLRRKGFELSWSRTHRLWRQAGLLVPRKRPRKRIASVRPRIHTPFKANMVWAYDFVFDTTASGQQIKCLTVVDEYTRECLAIDVAGAIRSRRVIEVLSRLVSLHGAPLFMRSDNGPEFVSHAILEWIAHSGIAIAADTRGTSRLPASAVHPKASHDDRRVGRHHEQAVRHRSGCGSHRRCQGNRDPPSTVEASPARVVSCRW